MFAGQRDDPFFVDLGATFDAINVRKLTGNQGQGKDDLSGMNTHAIVMQIPERLVTKNHKAVASADAGNAVVGVWSTTERKRLQVAGASRKRHHRHYSNGWVQVSRLGNPLVNEVVIPLGKKDQFNRTTPDRDAALYGKYVVKPELAAVLNALFDVKAPENGRTDIVQALLQGLPMLNQHKGIDGPPAVDTIKLNLGMPPADYGEPLRGHRRRHRRLPERPSPRRRRRGHRAPGRGRLPEGQQGAARRRGGPERRSVPVDVPVRGAPHSGFDSAPSTRVEPGHAPVPAGG